MIRKLFIAIAIIVLVLTAIILFKTYTFQSIQYTVKASPAPEITQSAIGHLQEAVRFRTISNTEEELVDSAQFSGFRVFLETTYPEVHKQLTREIVLGYSLLYEWKGKNPDLNPYIIMAHQDVVPIEEASRDLWTVDPFEGVLRDDYIWGRGTADDKINLISIMEATEKLLKENFQPERTIYLAFGHDEEIGGKGAIAIAAILKSRNVMADLILDEGGIITKEKVPGLNKPVALLGTSEKGYLSLELSVSINGGHSSMPVDETAIDVLSKALVAFRARPFEPEFSEPMRGMIKSLGPEMTFVQRMAFANPWIFRNLIVSTYEKSGPGNALIRTTAVPTIFTAGIKDNVVPTSAKATVNLRLLPGDGSQRVIEQLKERMNDDRILIKVLEPLAEASPIASVDDVGYKKIEMAIKQSYPGVLTSPFLMIAATDSRHFSEVSKNVIKFSPMIDPFGFHGIDERISLESFKTSIWFFENVIRNAN